MIKVKKRSTLTREQLTDDEALRIERDVTCPDCDGELLYGPGGGASRNLKCAKCGSMFNVVEPGNGFAGGERLNDLSRLAMSGLSVTEPEEEKRGLLSIVRGWLSRA